MFRLDNMYAVLKFQRGKGGNVKLNLKNRKKYLYMC